MVIYDKTVFVAQREDSFKRVVNTVQICPFCHIEKTFGHLDLLFSHRLRI